MVAEQLQHALNSRVVIEQAKGVLAERHNVNMDAAFVRLRQHARNHNLKLTELAGAVVRGGRQPCRHQGRTRGVSPTGTPTEVPPTTAADVICECGHLLRTHDAIAARYCRATEAGHMTRGCICAPASTTHSYEK